MSSSLVIILWWLLYSCFNFKYLILYKYNILLARKLLTKVVFLIQLN